MSAGLRRTVLLVAGLAALVAVAAFAKRRYGKRQHVQPIVEILAECA